MIDDALYVRLWGTTSARREKEGGRWCACSFSQSASVHRRPYAASVIRAHRRCGGVWKAQSAPMPAHARPSPSGVVAYDPTVTPCHEEPLPAVQPKQWLLVATALPVSSSKFSTS